MLGCNPSRLSLPVLSQTAADAWSRDVSAGMLYYDACCAAVASCGWSPAAILQMAATEDFSLVCSLVQVCHVLACLRSFSVRHLILAQSDIWNETVSPIACSGCVFNDLATQRNRFVDVVPVWLGLMVAADAPAETSDGDSHMVASIASLAAAADACRTVHALCSCVALFDASNAQSVSWVHVDANGLFWGFCADGALREYKHRWSFANSKCCFYGRCVALATLSRVAELESSSAVNFIWRVNIINITSFSNAPLAPLSRMQRTIRVQHGVCSPRHPLCAA
jgi:hypothetical protein